MAFSLSSALSIAIAKMSKSKQSLTFVLVAHDVKTLSIKNKSVTSECVAVHVQHVKPNEERHCDLNISAIDQLLTQLTLRYVLHSNINKKLFERKRYMHNFVNKQYYP